MDSTFGGRVPQGNLLWIGRQLSLSAFFLWEQWSETLPMVPMGRRGYKPISLQPPYPLPPSPSLLCIGSRMGPTEEGSPPYERERVTCMFISAACVLGSPPRSMPSGEGVWWLTSKSFQPPSLLPFFSSPGSFPPGAGALGERWEPEQHPIRLFWSKCLSSLVPSGLVTWASV